MPQPATKYLSKDVPATIANQFAHSFSDYACRKEYTAIMNRLEHELDIIAIAAAMGRPFGADAKDLLATAARGLTKQAVAGTIRSIVCGAAAHCESTIELAICLALGMTARAQEYAVLYDFGQARAFGDPDGDITVTIQPQVTVDSLRVDLLLTMTQVLDDQEPLRVFSKRAVVECDGHEFHERTKEQATADRERDRRLQAFGLNVLRFTGSDIWKDVFKCAEEVLAFLRNDIQRQRELPSRKPCTLVRIDRPKCGPGQRR